MVELEKYGLRAKRPEVIDSSMLSDYVDCPSKFYLRHVLGLRRKVRDVQAESPLDWGTVWHRVMEAWRLTRDQVKALEQLEPWPSSIMGEVDKHARSRERMAKIFFEYVEKFGEKDAREFEILRSEQFFDVWDEEAGLRWCGRMDGLERRRNNKRLQVREYKTTSRMGSYYFEKYEHSFQIPGYVWAANMMSSEPISHVMLDVLYTLKGSHEFYRRTLYYPPERLAEWRRNVLLWMSELNHMLDNHLEDPEAWKKSWNDCTRYSLCSFADIHFMPPSGDTRLRIMSNDFVEDRWDPRREDMDVT